MNTLAHPAPRANPIHIAPLCRLLLAALALCAYGLVFVYVKNQQHLLGQNVREIEKKIAEERAINEVLLARITALSSRAELQRKLQAGLIALRPIPQNCIAILTAPAVAASSGLASAHSGSPPVP